jgi:hypothetical protein
MGYFKKQLRRSGARTAVRRALFETRHCDVDAEFASLPKSNQRRPLYLRFSAGPADPDSHHQRGIFHAGDDLELTDAGREALCASRDWFNENLIAPRLDDAKAIFWFCASATDCLSRIWQRVALLRENAVPVRMLRCTDPGLVVYRDELQVAAIPQRRVKWRERVF